MNWPVVTLDTSDVRALADQLRNDPSTWTESVPRAATALSALIAERADLYALCANMMRSELDQRRRHEAGEGQATMLAFEVRVGDDDETIEQRVREQVSAFRGRPKDAPPVPMSLTCPQCGAPHIDEGLWAKRRHKTHQCQACKAEWRPFEYATVGVEASAQEPTVVERQALRIADIERERKHYDRMINECIEAVRVASQEIERCERERGTHYQQLVKERGAWDAKYQQLADTKNGAYAERNQCVAALARAARALGCPVWRGTHGDDPLWDPEWLNLIFIGLPTGQVSWHLHVNDMTLFVDYPAGGAPWDGHTTEEKYARLAAWRPPATALESVDK